MALMMVLRIFEFRVSRAALFLRVASKASCSNNQVILVNEFSEAFNFILKTNVGSFYFISGTGILFMSPRRPMLSYLCQK